MKGAGMLVVLLRGVNFGFWSHLGCPFLRPEANFYHRHTAVNV